MKLSTSILKLVTLLGTLAIAIASPAPQATITVTSPTPQPTDCNTSSLQCCSTVVEASSPTVTALLGLLGVVFQNEDILVGLACSPITVNGVGSGSSCTGTTVCCESNGVGGLISVGCIPVEL